MLIWMAIHFQVLYFQDFLPCSIPNSSLNALTNIAWQSYGLKPPIHAINYDEEVVLEWENLQSFAHISIAIHSYYGIYPTSSSLLEILHPWVFISSLFHTSTSLNLSHSHGNTAKNY